MTLFRLDTSHWHILRINFLMAGSLTLVSLGLAFYVDIYFLFIAMLVGAMQMVFAVTGYCPSAIILDRLGIPRT